MLNLKSLSLIFIWCFPAYVYAQTGNIDSLKNLALSNNKILKIQANTELCWEYKFRDADSARAFGKKAIELAEQINNDSLRANALHAVGITYQAQGNYQQALIYESQTLTLRDEKKQPIKVADSYNNLGIIQDELGNQAEALMYYDKARRIYEKHNELEKLAGVWVNIGIVHKAQKEYTKAITYYKRATDLYRTSGNEFGAAACQSNLGSIYLYLSKYDSSLLYSQQAITYFEEQKIKQFLPIALSNAAIAYDTLKNYARAIDYFKRAISIQKEFQSNKELSFSLIHLAGIYVKQKLYDEAKNLADEAYALAKASGIKEQQMQAFNLLAKISEAQQDYKSTLVYFKQAELLEDSIFQLEKTKQIATIETQYETEKKEQLLREQELKLTQNQYLIIFLIILFLLLLLVALLWRKKITIETKQLQAEREKQFQIQLTSALIRSQEKERSRVAKDLHDGLGQFISSAKMIINQSNDSWQKQADFILNEMHQEIRKISFNMMPTSLQLFGLGKALQELSDRLKQTIQVTIHINDLTNAKRLPEEEETALYRIIQEWINNSIKHAEAKEIFITLSCEEGKYNLMIEDNGRGFEVEEAEKSNGNGWKNMVSRMQMLNGKFYVDSSPAQTGTTFTLEFFEKRM
ncbi:MAG: sensor histidine kinase [Cyclobacteriaceae bacterium]|nr:sensor histidine kinase [Cyclobacteriaceae bacterium]